MKLGDIRRISIVSSKSKTCTVWWNTFSQALREIGHSGNSLGRDALKEKNQFKQEWQDMLEQMLEPMRTGWKIWKRIGQFMGDVIGRVFLTLYYFTLYVPFALGVRLWGDPLGLRPRAGTKWLERRTKDLTLKDSRRLF